MIEFALSFLLFMAVVTGFGQLALAVWYKTTLHHAVRTGNRFAITGGTLDGTVPGVSGQQGPIKHMVKTNSAGLINDTNVDTYLSIEFYNADGVKVSGAGSNAGGNTVVIKVTDYPIPTLISSVISWVPDALKVSSASVGRLEPYAVPPAL